MKPDGVADCLLQHRNIIQLVHDLPDGLGE